MLTFCIQNIWEGDEKIIVDYLCSKNIPYILHGSAELDASLFSENVTYFCYGSIQWIDQIQKLNKPNLISIATFNNYNSIVYGPFLNDFLLNRTSWITTLKNFIEEFDFILSEYNDKVFMRPCTGMKTSGIAGGVFTRNNFADNVEYFKADMNPNDYVLIDKTRSIQYEWRCIIAHNKCVSGCQYKSFDPKTKMLGFDPSDNLPSYVVEEANKIVQSIKWQPDPIFVLDIAQEFDGHLSIVEINALSTSGWYDCNPDPIISSIIELIK